MPRKPKSDADQVRDLLLWARDQKIALHDVTIGSVSVTIARDYGIQPPPGRTAPAERKQSILEQYAGALLPAMQPQSDDSMGPIVEDEE